MKRYFKLSLKIAVSLLLLIYLVNTIDFSKSLDLVLSSNTFYFSLSILLIILNYVFSSLRWKYLILSEKKISLIYLIKLYFIGSFFNNFLPTSIGGDAYKIVKLGDKINSRTDAFTATFLERFLGMVALLGISLFGVLSFSNSNYLNFIFGFVGVLIAFLLFLVFYPKFRFDLKFFNKIFITLDKIHSSFMRYKKHPLLIFYSFISSVLVQVLSVLSQFVLFLAVNVSLPVAYSFFAFPIIFLSGYAIPSLNGLGSQDVLYQNFFLFINVNKEAIIASSLLYHLARFIVSLIGGLIYLIDKKHE
jgi:uncharacterized protein (TIRG00374 family)